MNSDQRDHLIQSSVMFMQTVSEIYGPEKGMELWSTIADTIDTNLKGEVFMAMLSGQYRSDRLFMRSTPNAINNRVAVIKCIREYDTRNLGLKDAKDIADLLVSGQAQVLEVSLDKRNAAAADLRYLGVTT